MYQPSTAALEEAAGCFMHVVKEAITGVDSRAAEPMVVDHHVWLFR
jgi:hypothetical protein